MKTLTPQAHKQDDIGNTKLGIRTAMKPQDSIAVVTDSESEDDYKKKPFFRVPSPGKTAKRTKRGSQSSTYSTPPSPGSFHPPHHTSRRLSSEEIINQMEKEQDAMVMRLLKEIDLLREENVRLRRSLNQVSNSGSMSGNVSQISDPSNTLEHALSLPYQTARASSSGSSFNIVQQNTTDSRRPSSSSQLLDSLTPELQKKRNSITKNDIDYLEGYSPTLRTGIVTPTLSSTLDTFPRRASAIPCGSRRRRSSGRPLEDSDSSSINSNINKIPRRAGSPNTSLTIAR